MAIGIPLAEVLAAVERVRADVAGHGLTWSADEWARVWRLLTPNQQRVVYLRVLVGLTPSAVAEQLGLTRGGVDGAWRRALVRIREALPGTS